MKISKIIGVSAMAMLLATLMVSVASAAGGDTYATAQLIDVPYGNYKFGVYTSHAEDWWKFSASAYDNINVGLAGTFTQNGGKLYLHDPYEGVIKASIVCYQCPQNDYWGQVIGSQPRIEINPGTSFTYDFSVGRY
ncbi:MAG: hypothetical protein WA144_16480 [Candidatus Methanoperedens sp.]